MANKLKVLLKSTPFYGMAVVLEGCGTPVSPSPNNPSTRNSPQIHREATVDDGIFPLFSTQENKEGRELSPLINTQNEFSDGFITSPPPYPLLLSDTPSAEKPDLPSTTTFTRRSIEKEKNILENSSWGNSMRAYGVKNFYSAINQAKDIIMGRSRSKYDSIYNSFDNEIENTNNNDNQDEKQATKVINTLSNCSWRILKSICNGIIKVSKDKIMGGSRLSSTSPAKIMVEENNHLLDSLALGNHNKKAKRFVKSKPSCSEEPPLEKKWISIKKGTSFILAEPIEPNPYLSEDEDGPLDPLASHPYLSEDEDGPLDPLASHPYLTDDEDDNLYPLSPYPSLHSSKDKHGCRTTLKKNSAASSLRFKGREKGNKAEGLKGILKCNKREK